MKKIMLGKLAGALSVSTIIFALPAAAGQPGKGWDTFQTGAGEPVTIQTTAVGAVVNGAPGKGWDTFQTGAGEPIIVRQASAAGAAGASAMPGKGWDTYGTGAGEPIPAFASKAK